jgi:DNA-binding CsgD family transcriptional regulator
LEQPGCIDEAGIESCLSIGMVRGEDGSLAFRHELARRAFEADSAAVVRAGLDPYRQCREQRDPWARGMLAAWLWRAGALDELPADLPEPYALEIARDWKAAARAWETLGAPYEHANMLAWYGGEPEQREALAIFERLGAAPAAQSLRKRMRSQGIQSIPRGSRQSTRLDPHGLTKREAEILGLLSEGLRNSAIAKRLFLSTNTVDHHVSAVLTRLGVPSRAEAVAMARKGQLAEPAQVTSPKPSPAPR